ncbi:Outer membrane protein assembly factor YaeT precursor [Labilithrix luteola]|uniref:Outer membrane protein assembly factor YaeT n=1 Tax=Labilithrix luteola TaxID=1391654 RepID=A0A0K1PMA3_9BACT|nr:BamA/TamA family outer membrane protein [Labilithrix luteola]AKU94657.1 Outer membrane protein assembly factor YaeT precursor [Labilithrix luteola]
MSRRLPPNRRAAQAAALALGLVSMGCKTVPKGRFAVDEVTIRGAHAVESDDIEDKIATSPNPKFLGLFQGVVYDYAIFDRFILQRDLARVEAFYRTKGFYDVRARAGRIIKLNDKHVRVEIVVEEGKPIANRKVKVEGATGIPKEIASAVEAAAREGLPNGATFDEDSFEKTEMAVRRALLDRGYAYATAKGTVAVDIVQHVADVLFTVEPGPKCVFGKVTVEGLGALPEKPVRRAVDIKEDSPYSQTALELAQQAVLSLGVFASVELIPDLPGEERPPTTTSTPSTDGAAPADVAANNAQKPRKIPPQTNGKPPVIPIRVKVEPSRLRTIRLGGGLEFDALKTDIHGLVGWENRNFFGGMRTFSVTFRPGVVLYPLRVNNIVFPDRLLPEERLRIEFKQPGFIEGRTNGFIRPQFDVYPVLLDPNPPKDAPVLGYAELKNAIGVDRPFKKLFVSVSHNVQWDYPFPYIGPRDPTLSTITISYPELFVALDFRNDKIHPRRGFYLANTFQYAGGPFGGSAHDLKVAPEARGFVPLTRRTVLAARAALGFLEPYNYGSTITQSVSEFGRAVEETRDYQLTFFRGFFSGGPNSNRGYAIRGVGPFAFVPFLTPEVQSQLVATGCTNNSCRTPTGGFTLWELSMELRHSLEGPLSAALFCDASDVSPQPNNVRFDHPHLSCGIGVRYDTPVGPIRLDLGYRLPGLQVIGGLTAADQPPPTFLGIPMAVHIGVGEAY